MEKILFMGEVWVLHNEARISKVLIKKWKFPLTGNHRGREGGLEKGQRMVVVLFNPHEKRKEIASLEAAQIFSAEM